MWFGCCEPICDVSVSLVVWCDLSCVTGHYHNSLVMSVRRVYHVWGCQVVWLCFVSLIVQWSLRMISFHMVCYVSVVMWWATWHFIWDTNSCSSCDYFRTQFEMWLLTHCLLCDVSCIIHVMSYITYAISYIAHILCNNYVSCNVSCIIHHTHTHYTLDSLQTLQSLTVPAYKYNYCCYYRHGTLHNISITVTITVTTE